MKQDLGKEITRIYENLRRRKQLDEELKMTLDAFLSIVDEKADNKELSFTNDEWKQLGMLASRSVRDTESLWQFTNFIAEKF
ncbi:MAG: hypothetical protein LBQ96_03230 [Fusobacteriaceae bacterium]|jgi:hypothetical protein|nr:hypothetical protein [Fusobacteriaceae bacterium]